MLDVISGGRLVAGFPVGTPMDTNFCYGQIPALTREKYYEAHELIMRAWARARAVRVRRQVQPAPLRELLAAPDPEAAPADLHPGRRLDRDLGLLRRARLQLLATSRTAATRPARRCSTATGSASRRRARTSRPYRAALRAGRLRRRHRRGGRAALRRARALLLQPLPARVPGLRGPAGLPHGEDDPGRQAEPVPRREPAALHARSPGRSSSTAATSSRARPTTVRERMEHMIKDLRLGIALPAVPDRQHARRQGAQLDQALRREGHAAAARHLARVEERRSLLVQAARDARAPRGVARR